MFKMLLLIFTIITAKGEVQGDVKEMDTAAQCEAYKGRLIEKLAADPDVVAFAVNCGTVTAPTPNKKT